MKHLASNALVFGLLVCAVSAACAPDRSVAPDIAAGEVVVAPPSFARPGASNPTLSFTVATDTGSSGVFGDGGDDYANGACGVFAVINLSTSNALLDPDRDYRSNTGCSRRLFRLVLPDRPPVLDGSYVTIGATYSTPDSVDFADIPPGQTYDQRIGFMTTRATTGCDRIYFGYDPDDETHPVKVTRTSDTTWLLESQPGGQAKCVTSGKGGTLTSVWTSPMAVRLVLTQTSS